MAEPIDFPGSNLNLLPASGDEETVNAMRAFTNGTHVVECWRLTPDELAEVAKTGCIWLAMVGGVPPIIVGSKSTIRYFVADQGVWKE